MVPIGRCNCSPMHYLSRRRQTSGKGTAPASARRTAAAAGCPAGVCRRTGHGMAKGQLVRSKGVGHQGTLVGPQVSWQTGSSNGQQPGNYVQSLQAAAHQRCCCRTATGLPPSHTHLEQQAHHRKPEQEEQRAQQHDDQPAEQRRDGQDALRGGGEGGGALLHRNMRATRPPMQWDMKPAQPACCPPVRRLNHPPAIGHTHPTRHPIGHSHWLTAGGRGRGCARPPPAATGGRGIRSSSKARQART